MSLRADGEAIKGVRFLDAKGGEIEVNRQAESNMNGTCELTFTHKGEFPAQAHIIVQMYDNLKEYVTPFKVENLDLLGRTVEPPKMELLKKQ